METRSPTTQSLEKPQNRSRVLVAHENVSVMRLIREALENFTSAQVTTTPDAQYAFELSLQREYSLFIFQLSMPVLGGELLYGLISTAYKHSHEGVRSPPAIIYLADDKDALRCEELQRDARVKGVILKPLSIDRLLEKASVVLPRKI